MGSLCGKSQPKKAIAPSGSSLETCGLDTCLPVIAGQHGPAVGGQLASGGPPAQPAVGGNMYMYLQIVLPHAFVHGDGLGVRYVSQHHIDKEVLKEQSCLELLC